MNYAPYWPKQAVIDEGLYFYLEAIEDYRANGRVRVVDRGEMLLLGGYSYLGLNQHPRINEAAHEAIDRYGTGTHGVRLLAGTLDLHRQLESHLARFKRAEAALTFSSGYMANVSTLCCILRSGDTVLCDKRDHASIIDGCRMSGAQLLRFRHNDVNHLEALLQQHASGRRLVIVDAVYSMDGDVAPLPEIVALCQRYDALLAVDEAHSIGVLGAAGHGIEEHFGLAPEAVDIKIGTLSKAIPSVGGYIAASEELCEFIACEARGFIYSASLPPPAAAAADMALTVIEKEPERVKRLHRNIQVFIDALAQYGICFSDHATPIFPILCGDDWTAWRVANYCHREGIYVQAIPHPVVPKGSARLRAAVSVDHQESDLYWAAEVIAKAFETHGPESIPTTSCEGEQA